MTLVMRDSRQRGQDEEEEKTYNGGPVILQSNIAQQAGLLLSGTSTLIEYTLFSKPNMRSNN
jgi:hypothetical protein